MILLLAGTADAHAVGQALLAAGEEVLATTVTEYGRELLEEELAVRQGGLSKAEFIRLLSEYPIDLVVDASHPFAVEVSHLAMELCHAKAVKYIRFERPQTCLSGDQGEILRADSFEAAAHLALALPGMVFLTVGVKHLETFCRILPPDRLVARVLPVSESLSRCRELGIAPARIVALQGPFSKELNRALFSHYQAGVVITKESGPMGGTHTKLAAAKELGLPVILVQRPLLEYPQVVGSIEELLKTVINQGR